MDLEGYPEILGGLLGEIQRSKLNGREKEQLLAKLERYPEALLKTRVYQVGGGCLEAVILTEDDMASTLAMAREEFLRINRISERNDLWLYARLWVVARGISYEVEKYFWRSLALDLRLM